MGRVRDFVFGPESEFARRAEPLEGTLMSLWNSILPGFWDSTYGTSPYGTPDLAERVWVANRCIQLNAQQIASMPLEFHGVSEPAWVSSPDPNWYPNGIADALFSAVRFLYGWGYALLYVTAYYADGFPQFWTVLDSSRITVDEVDGERRYRAGDQVLDASRIIQIDRNPSSNVVGTPALRAYAQQAYAILGAAENAANVAGGSVPNAVIKSKYKVNKKQAETIQARWVEATANRGNTPAVIGPDLEFEVLAFDPADLSLLESQEFNAKAIATAFGVPSVLLNMALQGGLTYQNPAMLGEMWWRFELRPTATRIANALTAQALPRGQFVTFDAADTFAALTDLSDDDDPQLSSVAQASPAQQPSRLTAVVGGTQ